MATVPLVVTLLALIGCGAFATPRAEMPSPTAASTVVERGTEPVSPPATRPPTSTAPVEGTGKATPRPGRTPTATSTGAPSRTPTAAPEPTVTRSPTPPPAKGSAPRVTAFSAVVRDVVELSWDTTADHVTICPLADSGLIHCRCRYDLPGSGRTTIEPGQIIAPYTAFELSGYSGGARTIGRTSADVHCPGCREWFLKDPPAACPDGSPLTSPAAAQRFERGLMIWVAATEAYYIFYDRDLNVEDGRGWSSLKSLQRIEGPLALKPGAAVDNRVGEVLPADRFEPVSGFGLVWRGEVIGTEAVRERLGWAVEEEYAFEVISQCEAGCGPTRDCYLRGPQGHVLRLSERLHFGAYWEWWRGE